MKIALIPAFNAERTIAKVIVDCFDFCDEVIVCDDGSKDGTAKIAESQGCKVLVHKRNLGKGAALRSLFQEGIKFNPDIVITLDADGQHDPMEIPKLIDALTRNGADIVVGQRSKIPTLRNIGNRLLSSFGEIDTQSGYRVYSGKVIASLIPTEMGMGVDSEILKLAEEKKMRIIQVPISVRYDLPNTSTHNLVYHFLDVIFTTWKLQTFRHPLLLYGIPGLVFILGSIWFGFRSLGFTSQGVGAFPLVVNLALVSIYLMLIGLISFAVGIIIFSVVSLIRRGQQ